MVPSYDPELNLLYIGTSVTSPAPKLQLAGNDKKYLYHNHNCTLAMNADDALRKLYETLGVTPEKRVVTYCNSGMQATQSYFTLKYLGYDVRLYDGSMSEWTSKGAPVEK